VVSATEVAAQVLRQVIPQVKALTTTEMERTRQWFITHALPKAIRVSHRSAYDVLRAHGHLAEPKPRPERAGHSGARAVGKNSRPAPPPRPLNEAEIAELAQSCLALLMTQGQQIEQTVADIGVAAGGFLLPEDAARVRAEAESLVRGQGSATRA
jgi:hypothetical protein